MKQHHNSCRWLHHSHLCFFFFLIALTKWSILTPQYIQNLCIGREPSLFRNCVLLILNCGLKTDFVVLWLAGYLACARCAASGSIIAVDALATADGAVAPTTSQRCPNCMGATKVLTMVYLFLFAFVFVKHQSVLESFQVPNLSQDAKVVWGQSEDTLSLYVIT